jgi:hypothetical protein
MVHNTAFIAKLTLTQETKEIVSSKGSKILPSPLIRDLKACIAGRLSIHEWVASSDRIPILSTCFMVSSDLTWADKRG